MWNFLSSLFTPMVPVPQISADDLKQILDSKMSIVLIDVRTRSELSRGKIPGCMSIPLDELEAVIEQKVPEKDTPLYLYCLSGTRSDKAGHFLLQKGYTSVKSLTSGMLMWRYKKYPIE